MELRSLLFVPVLAGIVGACAVVDPVDSRYDTISRSLAKARNKFILLNLVRASHDYPLSFVTISNVTPTLTNTTGLGLPEFLLGSPTAAVALLTGTTAAAGAVVFDHNVAANATSVGTNFNVSTQETSAFYAGFLKPVDLQTLAYFIRQGYPPEMLFWLFADSFELIAHGQSFGYRYEPPHDYGCAPRDPKQRCFVDWIRIATLSGLTVEEKTLAQLAGGRPTKTTFARFCFSEILAERARGSIPKERLIEIFERADVTAGTSFAPKCGSAWDSLKTANTPQSDTLPLTVGAYQFKIIGRSAYGVFEFLGALMKVQREHLERPDKIPPNRPSVLSPPSLSTVSGDPALITVVRNGEGDCFSRTRFEQGDYCVPENATTTKRIFGLLAQIIAFQTAANDLSITPMVRIIQ